MLASKGALPEGRVNPLAILEEGREFTKAEIYSSIPSNDRLYGTIDKDLYQSNGVINEQRFQQDFAPLIKEWTTNANSVEKQAQLRTRLKAQGFTDSQINLVITARKNADLEGRLRKFILSEYDFLIVNPGREPLTVEEFFANINPSEISRLSTDFIARNFQSTVRTAPPISVNLPPPRNPAIRETVSLPVGGKKKSAISGKAINIDLINQDLINVAET